MYDIIIKGGLVVDGTGAAPRQCDIAVSGGKIVEMRPGLTGEAAETIDANGRIVTPGWVDVHTHYDGQVTWDSRLDPSAGHGVTTIVTGNCGVGFAPVRPGSEDWLVQLMEGVEDIPGAALSEGIQWGWETFPEYLDALDSRHYAMDVGTQIPHGSLRGYVMGERGAKNEPANADEIALMARHVKAAIEAGALGFSTSRTLAHRARDGEPVPGTFAEEDELFAIGRAIRDGGGGMFEVAQAGLTMLDRGSTAEELDWIARLAADTENPVSYMVLQTDTDPDLWAQAMDRTTELTADGLPLWVQVAARPFGMLIGLATNHPFLKRPSYEALAGLPLEERAERMRTAAVRDAILGEADGALDPNLPFDGLGPFLQIMLDRMFPMGDVPDYEPEPDTSIGLRASANGLDKLAHAYEMMTVGDGSEMFLLPLFNYTNNDHEAIREMLLHPRSVSSLGDAGAHCGMICDASIPTYLLTHWARDRRRGATLPIEFLVKKQTADTAALYGMHDRGVLAVGKKADINVIDFDNLRLHSPHLAHDLPAGGRRLLQSASGYEATICSGVAVTRKDTDTGARPGRLIRS